MKNLYAPFTLSLLAMLMLTSLTSCDSDAERADSLDGSWTGQIDTYYYDRWGLTGNSYATTIYFRQNNLYGGVGYEVDYDVNSRYRDYYYCEFDWTVSNGTIVIRYADSWQDTYIYDYQLSYKRLFQGFMDDGTSREIRFALRYDGAFEWDAYRTRYYAPTRSALATDADVLTPADSLTAPAVDQAAGRRCYASGVFANPTATSLQSSVNERQSRLPMAD